MTLIYVLLGISLFLNFIALIFIHRISKLLVNLSDFIQAKFEALETQESELESESEAEFKPLPNVSPPDAEGLLDITTSQVGQDRGVPLNWDYDPFDPRYNIKR